MKTLNFEQMEAITAGNVLSCMAQVTGGMSTLATIASIGIFSLGPVGWGIFALGAISLITGVAADPTACD